MMHISLFSGIGGFDLASEWMGWTNIASCEINPFCNKILKHYWPDAYHHDDIKTLTYETINAELSRRFGNDWRNDDIIITGGFRCQPYSAAGKRLGKEDDRHLWPEMLRVIREVRPTWIVGENVFGLVNWSGGLVFEEVQTDLEAEGYEVQPYVLPAASVGAPHRRDRVWFVAYNTSKGLEGSAGKVLQGSKFRFTVNSVTTDTENARQQTRIKRQEQKQFRGADEPMGTRQWSGFPTQSAVCSRNDGLSYRLDNITFSKWRNESIKAYGNAIVPQVALQIFKAINIYSSNQNSNL